MRRTTTFRRWKRRLPAVLLAVLCGALLTIFPGSLAAATVTVPGGQIVVQSFGVSLPNDPNRCVAFSFVQFAPVPGGSIYTAVIANNLLGGQHQTFSTAPPYATDHYSTVIGNTPHTFDAPAGTHWIGPLGSHSVGDGCADAEAGMTEAVTLVSLTTDVTNTPPSPAFTAQKSAADPLTIGFDASASSDDKGITSYDWDFGDGGTGSGVITSHAYAVPGLYSVKLTVKDSDGETASTSQRVKAGLQSPVAAYTRVNDPADPLELRLDGSASHDPDGTIVSYAWSITEQGACAPCFSAQGASEVLSTTVPRAGSYRVSLIVTDDDGLTDDAASTEEVSATNEPPTAAFAATRAPSDHYTFTFDGTTSSDADGRVVSYDWDFGDGGTATGATAKRTYAAHGSYDVTLTVVDDDGMSGSKKTTVLANKLPTAQFTSAKGPLPLSIAFDASGTTDDHGVVSFDWSFGDGSTGSGETPRHVYAGAGTFPVELRVTDDDGEQIALDASVVVAGNGGYRVELPKTLGEDSDLILDRNGDLVGVECSFGSVFSKASSSMIDALGLPGVKPGCQGGVLALSLPLAVDGELAGLKKLLSSAFDGAKVFPASGDSKPQQNGLLKALGVDDLGSSSKGLGGLLGKLKSKLPPPGDGIVSVTPPPATARKLSDDLSGIATTMQDVNQAIAGMKSMAQNGLQPLTPSK
jgi:PKD repeat protein